MNWLESRIFRTISGIVLTFFCWTFGGIFDVVAYAAKSDQQSAFSGQQSSASVAPGDSPRRADQPKAGRPEGKLQKIINDIVQIVQAVQAVQTVEEKNVEKNKLRGKKAEIEVIDVEIRTQFAETEDKIKNLPETIKQRHRDFVAKYEENLNELKANLDTIERLSAESLEFEEAIENTKIFLEKVKPPKKHIPLDPNKLPHRTAEPTEKKPRTKKEEFKTEQRAKSTLQTTGGQAEHRQEPILVASNGTLDGLLTQDSKYFNNAVIPAQAGIQGSGYPIETLGYDRLNNLSNPGAYGTSELSNLLLAAADPPTSADLAETIEVQFTPAIIAKATELENKPVLIYNWVRNNIEFVPTYGSIQGADMCLQTKLCNAFDTASLLIALLRASGIHARYVEGTVEIPIEKVKNWVGGFTDDNSALSFIASGGIPGTILTSGGEIVAAQMEHIWVEAYVPYGNYRGLMRDDSIKTWIPMDGSFKQYEYIQGIDIQSATGVDPLEFYNQLNSLVTVDPVSGGLTSIDIAGIETQLISLQGNLTNYLDNNMPDSMLKEIIGGRTIKDMNFTLLPSTLPYKILSSLDKYSEIPSSYRYKIAIHMTDENGNILMDGVTKSLPALSGQRITISYNPATDSDADILSSYSTDGVQSLPAYLINLAPALSVEGVEVARGTYIKMGSPVTINVKFIKPGGAYDLISHKRVAGEYSAFVLNYGSISETLLSQRSEKLQTTKMLLENMQTDSVTKDDILGEILNTALLDYWSQAELADRIGALSQNVAAIRLPSGGLNTLAMIVSEVWGIPYEVTGGGMLVDIQRKVSVAIAKDGDRVKSQNYMFMTGSYGSFLESAIYDEIFQQPEAGVSAVSIIKLSAEQGIPVYSINSNNLDSILQLLQVDSAIRSDIVNAVNAGKHVIVPQKEITHNGWSGTGYVIFDPETGAGAFMISGGMAGGWSPIDWFNNLGAAGKIVTIIILGIVAAFVITLLVVVLIQLIVAIIALVSLIIESLFFLAIQGVFVWQILRNAVFISCIITAIETVYKYTPPGSSLWPKTEHTPFIIGLLSFLIMGNLCAPGKQR